MLAAPTYVAKQPASRPSKAACPRCASKHRRPVVRLRAVGLSQRRRGRPARAGDAHHASHAQAPQESRTTSSTGSVITLGGASGSSIARTRASAAARPSPSLSWRTVVSAGRRSEAIGMSSKPTTARSCGHAQARVERRQHRPDGHQVARGEQRRRPLVERQQLLHAGVAALVQVVALEHQRRVERQSGAPRARPGSRRRGRSTAASRAARAGGRSGGGRATAGGCVASSAPW